MTRIVVDESLRKRLRDLRDPLELCDESGRVLAHLTPIPERTECDLQPQISHEEVIRRRRSNEPVYTTAEVLAHLERL